jgi:hypothetical protein
MILLFFKISKKMSIVDQEKRFILLQISAFQSSLPTFHGVSMRVVSESNRFTDAMIPSRRYSCHPIHNLIAIYIEISHLIGLFPNIN